MKKVLITGVSSGLGLELVKHLLTSNYFVIGVGRNEIKEKWIKKSPNFVFYSIDLRYGFDNEKQLKEIIKTHSPIHCVINNAGYGYDDLITNAKGDDVLNTFQINVISPILISKLCLRDMLLRKTKGVFVHITSISSKTGYKGLAMYGATKGALESFSIGLAREWGSIGIRSNCVSPGFMETNMTAQLTEEQKSRIYKRASIKKAVNIQSVVHTVLFLLSDKASSITGESVRVDNGTI